MNPGRTVFAQLIAHLSQIEFQKCVIRYKGDQHRGSLSCWDQLLAMADGGGFGRLAPAQLQKYLGPERAAAFRE